MGKRSAVKNRHRQAAQAKGAPERGEWKDWKPGSRLDPAKLETGVFKFQGAFELRSQERISQRELGKVRFEIRAPGLDEWVRVKLWDFTSISFGILLLPAGEASAAAVDVPKLDLHEGDEIQIRVEVDARQRYQVWCQVKNMLPWNGGIKVGLRRLDVAVPQSVAYDRRESSRLALSPGLSLRARIKHPYLFGHWCALSVSDVNKDMGLSFASKDNAILLFEGMEVEVHFELASFRNRPMTARVMWVHATEANDVRFGIACLFLDWTLHNALCAFLLHSQLWTPGKLRDMGFRVQFIKSHLRFRSVKTMDDYAKVLCLRRDAYVGAGKTRQGTTPEEMATPLDGSSRILMALHQGRLVGTLTFTFPATEATVLDSQAGFPGRIYPVRIPPKANLIEVSRLCIHEEYRGTDLLQGLFEQGLKHFLMSDRHWLLTSAVEDLMPLYERIGFKRLNAAYKHPRLNNQEHHLILAHRNAFLYGAGMNLFVWNTLFGQLVRYLLDRGLVPSGKNARALVWIKRLFGPLSKMMVETRARRGFRKHLETIRAITRMEPESRHSLSDEIV